MDALVEADSRMRDDGDGAVLKAAATTFGFVYIQPFQDGNGRMHRCLIHHVLAERKFTRPGPVFPVSSVLPDRLEEYRAILQAHSGPLVPFIAWRPTPERNVEFLYACARRTVDEDPPQEIDYLRRYDEAIRRIMDAVHMPDRTAENLVAYIRDNHGMLSQRRRHGKFAQLRDDEVTRIEATVPDSFEGSAE